MYLTDPSLLRTQAFIDGQWVAADSGKTFPVTNPSNDCELAQVADCGVDETRRAIDAANTALPAWRAKTAQERAAILKKWFELIIASRDDLALLMTLEQGKPLSEAKGRG